jgi:membrane associated rhomboid family serine protease
MAKSSILDQLKHQYNNGGMHIRLIAWNLAVFILIQIGLYLSRDSYEVPYWVNNIFGLQSDGAAFIRSPWGLFTSIFSHFGFMHLLFNMVFLFFTGQMFLQFFSGKRLLYTYIFGGIMGGLVQIAIGFFPMTFGDNGALVVGASGSIMAIFIALAVYKPQLKVHLFGVFPLPLFVLAIFFVVNDFLDIGSNDGIAHFVHLGGALFGFLSVRNMKSPNNLLNILIQKTERVVIWLKSKFSGSKLRKIQGQKPASQVKDEEFNENKKMTQDEIDAILDKISRSGYDSLTKLEKEFLFKQSRK